MPVKTLQNGSFQYPDGTLIANGTAIFTLSQSATITSSGQVAPRQVSFTLDANANMPAGAALWGNDDLSPGGTYYNVEALDSNGNRAYGPEKWNITGASPINLNNMIPTLADPSWASPVLQNPTGNQTITGAFDLTLGQHLLPSVSGQNLGSVTARWNAFLNTLQWYAATTFQGIFTHANTANRTYTLPDVTGNVPSLPTAATTESGSGAIVRTTSPSLTTPSLGVAAIRRIAASQGTALVPADIALSAGWGTTASVGSIIGTDQGFQFVVTSAGTGQGANPTITVTDKDGTWTNSPIVIVKRSAGSQLTIVDTWTVTATALTITFNGTPVAAETYTYNVIKMGR